MQWKKLRRSLFVVLVVVSVVAGAIGVSLGVWYAATEFGVGARQFPGITVPAFLIALYYLSKVGRRLLFPSDGVLDRMVPLPEPTTRQRFWRIGQEIKGWVDSAVVGLLAIGGAIAVGALAHRLGFGTWTIVAVVVLVWGSGIFAAVWFNAWTSRRLARYQPPSETETLVKTFD